MNGDYIPITDNGQVVPPRMTAPDYSVLLDQSHQLIKQLRADLAKARAEVALREHEIDCVDCGSRRYQYGDACKERIRLWKALAKALEDAGGKEPVE